MTDTDGIIDGMEQIVLALARHLVEAGKAELVEAAMLATVDPFYAAIRDPDLMLRMVVFCDRVRGVTGLPIVPPV